jgi:hypothetical protein
MNQVEIRLPTEATESRDLGCTEVLPETIARRVSPGAILRRWYWTSRLRVLLAEVGSSVCRMRRALDRLRTKT